MTRHWILITLCVSSLAYGDGFVFHGTTFRVGPFPTDIAAVDMNGDGIPEIITANRGHLSDPAEERPADDQLSYLVAKEPLEYVAQPQLRTGFGPYALEVVNIDALKAPDLVVANFMATRNRDLSLLRNLGEDLFEVIDFEVDDEQLQYAQRRDGVGNPVFTVPGFTSLTVHDFDGDGYRDAVVTGWSSDIVAYFPGDPEAYFGEPVLSPVFGSPRDVVAHDFDGDGRRDLAVSLYRSGEIALLRGLEGGRFEEVNRFASRGALPTSIVLDDFNGDGRMDLAVSHRHADDSIVLFYRDDDFQFPVAQEIVLGEDRKKIEAGIRDIEAVDFNNDRRPDLVVSCAESATIVTLTNVSQENAAIASFERTSYSVRRGVPYSLCAADFNGDGRVDIGVTLWEEDRVALLMGR